MKSATAPMNTHIDGEVMTLATCWRIKRRDNQIFGFTDYHSDIVFDDGAGDGSITYKAATAYQRSAIQGEIGLEQGGLTLQGILDSAAITAADLRAGKYDYAELKIFRLNYLDLSMEEIKLGRGRLGPARLRGALWVCEFQSLAKLLDRPILRTIEPLCDADLGDSRCTVNLAGNAQDGTAITQTGSVASVTDTRIFTTTLALSGSAGFFSRGKLTFTSGPNAGLKREIKSYDAGTKILTLADGFPALPAVGNTFSAVAGCDVRFETCKTKFLTAPRGNADNFRGFPHVPTKQRRQFILLNEGGL